MHCHAKLMTQKVRMRVQVQVQVQVHPQRNAVALTPGLLLIPSAHPPLPLP